jgi:hypothetical protein
VKIQASDEYSINEVRLIKAGTHSAEASAYSPQRLRARSSHSQTLNITYKIFIAKFSGCKTWAFIFRDCQVIQNV